MTNFKQTNRATMLGMLGAALILPSMAMHSTAMARKKMDTSLPGTDAFSQNKKAAKLIRKAVKAEQDRQNDMSKKSKKFKTISADSNHY